MATKLPSPRAAEPADVEQLLRLWGSIFGEQAMEEHPWRDHARTWFSATVDDSAVASIPVIDVGARIVACAVGTLELGVPNPQCQRGRVVRLANVATLPEYRGRGFGTSMVDAVLGWARDIQADRVDLSATPDGQRLYERAGFVLTAAPRMKLSL